jgi:alpha-tubulin suppressor-like RCC1 family protein
MPVTRAFMAASIARTVWRSLTALTGAAVVALAGAAAPAAAAPRQPEHPAALQALAPPSLFDWGDEALGELGNGVNGPDQLAVSFGKPAMIAASPAPIPLPASVRQLVAFDDDGMALLSNGTVATWGDGSYGQTGDGVRNISLIPIVLSGLTGITQIAGNGGDEMALDSSGAVWIWGNNFSGQAGNGTHDGQILTPQRVPGLSGVVQIAAGDASDYALKSDGTVWAWGYNEQGELGDDTTLNRFYPSQVPGLTGISKIAAGEEDAYAIRPDGSVMAWGNNQHGLLGNGTGTGMSTTPVQVPGLTGVSQISASDSEAFALTAFAGTVWAWGDDGNAGDGTISPYFTPVQIGLSGVSQISAGEYDAVAVLSNGSVLTWGDNSYGDLGTGTTDFNNHPSPVLVRTLAGGSLVASGEDDVMVVASPAPRIPSVIDDTQAEAAQVLQAAGYVLGRVSTVVDITCQYLGVVKTQSPAAGTVDPPGTSVAIAIGKAGGKCLG